MSAQERFLAWAKTFDMHQVVYTQIGLDEELALQAGYLAGYTQGAVDTKEMYNLRKAGLVEENKEREK